MEIKIISMPKEGNVLLASVNCPNRRQWFAQKR